MDAEIRSFVGVPSNRLRFRDRDEGTQKMAAVPFVPNIFSAPSSGSETAATIVLARYVADR
jgi:hypothetical protein